MAPECDVGASRSEGQTNRQVGSRADAAFPPCPSLFKLFVSFILVATRPVLALPKKNKIKKPSAVKEQEASLN